MHFVSQIAFALMLAVAGFFAYRNFSLLRRNILLGRPENRSGRKGERWATMLRVAFGQSKMVRRRTLAGVLHVFVYVGFFVVNIEVIEIMIDGLSGQHRILAPILGPVYDAITISAEVFLGLVLLSVLVFLARRGTKQVPRLAHPDLKGWPQADAHYILYWEIFLVVALLVMNANEQVLQARGETRPVGTFPLSQFLAPMFAGMGTGTVHIVERLAWWGHIIGILGYLNYLPFSKHLHILLAFPNVYYSQLTPKGNFPNNEIVKREVDAMMNPAAPQPEPMPEGAAPPALGAKDVTDLTWKNLLDAYTCTECGRCTASCPANLTGKLLSPRRIMQMTRDRAHDYGQRIGKDGTWADDGKSLHHYIGAEELWACTTCNACHEACPVNINPMDIIVQMRQYLVMEKSAAPEPLNIMFMNVENSQSPWAFPAADRFNWAESIPLRAPVQPESPSTSNPAQLQ